MKLKEIKKVYVINKFLSNFNYEVGKYYSFDGNIRDGNYTSLMEYYNNIDDILDMKFDWYGSDFLKKEKFTILIGKISKNSLIRRFDKYYCTGIEIVQKIDLSSINRYSKRYLFDEKLNLLHYKKGKHDVWYEYLENEIIYKNSEGEIKKYEIKRDDNDNLLLFRDNVENAWIQYTYKNNLKIKEIKNVYGTLIEYNYIYDEKNRLIECIALENNKQPIIEKYKYDKYGDIIYGKVKKKYCNNKLIEKKHYCSDNIVITYKYHKDCFESFINNKLQYKIKYYDVD
jgi:hypothetical protein